MLKNASKSFHEQLFDAFLSVIIRCKPIPSLQKITTSLRYVAKNVTTKLHIVEMWQ